MRLKQQDPLDKAMHQDLVLFSVRYWSNHAKEEDIKCFCPARSVHHQKIADS